MINNPQRARYLGRALTVAVLAVSGIVFGFYVPCVIGPPTVKELQQAEPFAAPTPLDWYILRDASGSVTSTEYDALEEAIRGRFCARSGDRVVRAYFGSWPHSLSAPLDLYPALSGGPSSPEFTNETNFGLLFDAIRKAIRDERNAAHAGHRAHNADAVVIITDGIPDVAAQGPLVEPSNPRFIGKEVVKAFNDLVDERLYCTREPIEVRLALLGVRKTYSAATIKQAWDNSILGAAGPSSRPEHFVAFAANNLKQLESLLFNSLARTPRASVVLTAVGDDARRDLDHKRIFSVKYEARAHIKGGSFAIDRGELNDPVTHTSIKLRVMKDQNYDPPTPTEQTNQLVIDVPNPEPGNLVGEPVPGSIYLRPLDGMAAPISKYATYDLFLTPVSRGGVATAVIPALRLGSTEETQVKSEVKTRLLWPFGLLFALLSLFCIGAFLWVKTSDARSGRWRKLHAFLDRRVIDAYLAWLVTAFGLAVIAVIGLWRIGNRVVAAVVMAVLLGATVTFYLLEERHRSSLLLKCVGLAIESLLPLAIHWVETRE